MDFVGTIELISRAQSGDDLATTELFNIVKDHHMGRYVGRYFGRNITVGDDEIESEFLLGVWTALPKAKLDVGNPLNYICWKGQKAVQSLLRTRIRKETRYECLDCGDTGIMGWRAKVPVCQKCSTTNIFTWMPVDNDMEDEDTGVSLVDTAASADSGYVWQLATYGIQIEEMRARLDGRRRDLFDIIIFEGISSESSNNYLQEIAELWDCSVQTVVRHLRKLRSEIKDYISEQA